MNLFHKKFSRLDFCICYFYNFLVSLFISSLYFTWMLGVGGRIPVEFKYNICIKRQKTNLSV